MIIVLNDLASGSTPLSLTVPEPDERLALEGAARFEGALQVGDRIELHGRLEAAYRLDCSRCLEAYVHPIEVELALRIVGDGAESGPAEAVMQPEDADLIHARDGKVDLAELLVELLLLEVPLKPVCSDDCRGLCPACGENRNRLECGCETDSIDPRLAPLLDLRRRSRS